MIMHDKKMVQTIGGGDDMGDDSEMLHGIMEDLIHAVKMGDVESAAMAFKAAIQACESEPRDEDDLSEEEAQG